jgi:hypothetical protein
MIPANDLKVTDVPENETKNAFRVEHGSGRRKFVLTATKASSKMLWMQNLKHSIEQVVRKGEREREKERKREGEII